jgi:hypothetical protein
MRARDLVAPVLVAMLVVGCQGGTESPAPNGKPSTAPTKGVGLRNPLKTPPVVIPESTTLHLIVDTALSSATSKPGDAVVAKLADAVAVGEKTALPEGAEVLGHVTAAAPSGRVKGLARLAFDFDRVRLKGKEYPIEARAIDITADNTHKRDAAIVGGGTAGGAIIGAIAGGKKGAGIGALVGAAAGTGVVLTNHGKEVVIPSGAHVGVQLTRAVTLD